MGRSKTAGENQPLLGNRNGNEIINKSPISPGLRWTTNVLSLLSVFLYSGIIFGWAPLELMLLREGQYSEICAVPEEKGEICPEQMIRLQGMFTVGQFLLSFVSIPVGWLVDHASKTLYYAITAAVQVAGLAVFAFSDSKSSFDYFVLGYGLMALGGNMTMLGAFPASFLIPSHQTGILAANSCFFDASSIIFFFFNRLNLGLGWSRRDMFLAWAIVCIAVYATLGICWSMLEAKHWKTVIEKETSSSSVPRDGDNRDEEGGGGQAFQKSKNQNGFNLHKQTLWKQLQSTEFALVTSFASLHMLRCNYFIMTVDDFLRFVGDNGYYANIFSFVLPCGVVFVPVIDYTMKQIGVLNTVHLTNLLGVIFGSFLCIPVLDIQVVTFGIFACFRAYLYSTANNFVAIYFGVATMGRVIGFVFTTAAIVSLVQYPMAIFAGYGDWFMANFIMLGLCIIPIVQTFLYKETEILDDEMSSSRQDALARSPILTMPMRLSRRLDAEL